MTDLPIDTIIEYDTDWDNEPEMSLRPYQVEAAGRIKAELYGARGQGDEPDIDPHGSTLLVMATGLGKTIVAADAIKSRRPGRALVLAHRTELLEQAKTTLEYITGEPCGVEKAERYAPSDVPIVVASVQTMIAAMGDGRRMERFLPDRFSLVWTDESHHAPAASYKAIYQHFLNGTGCKHLGVTATPDRHDEKALGQVYESVAYTYEIFDAVRDGWLVPVEAIPIHVEGLDYSSVRTTAGDLNGADLAHVMEEEAPLHEMLQAVVEVVCRAPQGSLNGALREGGEIGFRNFMDRWSEQYRPRKTLVFAASVVHAERLAEILNRWIPDSAAFVCGKTHKDERAKIFADFKVGKRMFLVNVGVATEGFDEPSIDCIVMARPTKSRALYGQMLGRGTRALPGIVDGPDSAEARRAAIIASAKPKLSVIDFVGNCGKHTLMTPADVLGGNYEDAVVALARRALEESDGRPEDIEELLEKARLEEERRREEVTARRAKLRMGSKYRVGHVLNPFKLFNVVPQRERGWEVGKPITEKMKAALERQKLWHDDMTYSEARQFIQGMAERREQGYCTFRMANLLARYGLPTKVSFELAHRWIDGIAAAGWKSVPQWIREEAKESA